MTLAIEEVLAVWRDAERVRDTLPADHPRRAAIDVDIAQLRAIYARMTSLIASSNQDLRLSAAQIDSARETLERVRTRLDAAAPSSDQRSSAPRPGRASHFAAEPAEG